MYYASVKRGKTLAKAVYIFINIVKPVNFMNPRKFNVLLYFVIVLSLASHNASANNQALIKSWKCKLEYGDFDIYQNIEFNTNDTYFSEMLVVSSSTTEEGTWRSVGNKVFLKPNKTIQRGKEVEPRAEYERQIVDVSESKLTINHNDAFGYPVMTFCRIK